MNYSQKKVEHFERLYYNAAENRDEWKRKYYELKAQTKQERKELKHLKEFVLAQNGITSEG